MILFIRSVLFFLCMGIATVSYGSVVLLLFFINHRTRMKIINHWSKAVIWLVKIICGIKYKIIGKENIPDKNAIIFCKHQSAWETLFLNTLFPNQSWILKKELLSIPFFGWSLAMCQPIAIDRSDRRVAMKQILEQGEERLKQGRWLIFFPEGTRVQPGQQKKFTRSGAMLAEKSGFPVLPIAQNSGNLWPRRGFIKKPGLVTLQIGSLIESKGRSHKEINEAAKSWIDATMKTLDHVED